MRTLYIDCGMGAAGDMLTAALLELAEDREQTLKELNSLGIPGVEYLAEKSVKCGVEGTHIRVKINGEEEGEHEHHHHHSREHDHEHSHVHHGFAEVEDIISKTNAPDAVKTAAISVYKLIAEAESAAHGQPVEQIHFHEVGNMDAIADVTAVCYLMNKLAPEQVIASPVHVGSGKVHCAHGIMPVPAPATAYILKDVPVYGGEISGELCTPTGAALLKYFASDFAGMPLMKISSIGYGMGKKDFPAANCVRTLLGNTMENSEHIVELSCNVDDMTGEQMGFAMDRLFELGALEVYTTAVGMKKNRPGVLLTVLCKPAMREKIVEGIFRHTTTIGIRENLMSRYTLSRSFENIDTPFGPVQCKISEGYGVTRRKYEHDDLARIAAEQGISIEEVKSKIGK